MLFSGFSKLSKSKKIDWIVNTYFSNGQEAKRILEQYWNIDEKIQQLHDEFIENTISNYYLPLGVAPNFLINGKIIPFLWPLKKVLWLLQPVRLLNFGWIRGGFKTQVISTTKIGQVHFMFHGNPETLDSFF